MWMMAPQTSQVRKFGVRGQFGSSTLTLVVFCFGGAAERKKLRKKRRKDGDMWQGQRLCWKCFTIVEDDWDICQGCESDLFTSKCKNCNQPVARSWRKCKHCGHELPQRQKKGQAGRRGSTLQQQRRRSSVMPRHADSAAGNSADRGGQTQAGQLGYKMFSRPSSSSTAEGGRASGRGRRDSEALGAWGELERGEIDRLTSSLSSLGKMPKTAPARTTSSSSSACNAGRREAASVLSNLVAQVIDRSRCVA